MEPFGPWLRREREQRGITLQQISSSTKIGTHYLQALEDDRLEVLPGGVIGRGFVRAYANYLGIDEEQAIAGYLARRGETLPPPVVVPEPEPESAVQGYVNLATQIPSWVLAFGFLIIGVGFITLGEMRQHYGSIRAAIVRELHPARHSRVAAQPATPTEAQTPAQTQPSTADGKGTQPSAAPATQGAPVTIASATPPPSDTSGDASSDPDTDSSNATDSESAPLTLLIRVKQDAWMSVIADGHHVLTDTVVAPAVRTVRARSQIVIRSGNIGGVDLSLNGEHLPPQGGYDESKTLSFSASGLARRSSRIVPASSRPPVPTPVDQ